MGSSRRLRRQREGTVGVSSPEAALKSSRSFGSKIAVGPNGGPPLAGRGMIVPAGRGSNPEQQVVPRTDAVRPVLSQKAKRSGLFVLPKCEKEKKYAKRITESVRPERCGAPHLSDVAGQQLLPGGTRSREKTVFHRDAAPQ